MAGVNISAGDTPVLLSIAKDKARRAKIVITSHALGASNEKVVVAFRMHQPCPIIDERKYG